MRPLLSYVSRSFQRSLRQVRTQSYQKSSYSHSRFPLLLSSGSIMVASFVYSINQSEIKSKSNNNKESSVLTQDQRKKEVKIYISADMEGIAGVVTDQQLLPDGFEYERFRKFMTEEVCAAIRGAFEGGATQVVVSDSHGNGQNILVENLPKNVLLIRSWPRPLKMMQGIDETFSGAIFLGYHTSTHNTKGVRAHTFSSAKLTGVRLNGNLVSEAGFNAAIAGHFNVPVIMITGDNEIVKETQDTLGLQIEGAIVKWALGFHSAKTLTPQDAQELIQEKAKKAVSRLIQDPKSFTVNKVSAPYSLDISFKSYRPVELLEYLPIVKRLDSRTVRIESNDILNLTKIFAFILALTSLPTKSLPISLGLFHH